MALYKQDGKEMPCELPLGIGHLRLIRDENGVAEDFVFLEVNGVFEVLTGVKREAVVGKPAAEVLFSHDPERAYWLSFFEHVVRAGHTQEMTQWIRSVRRYLTVTVIPAGGLFVSLVLRAAHPGKFPQKETVDFFHLMKTLEAVFDSTVDAVSLLEHRGRRYYYIQNNSVHQELTGIRNIRGREIREVMGESVGAWLMGHYETCLCTGRPVNYEQEYHFIAGRRVWRTEVAPIFNNGGIRYLLCRSKDVTELKEIQGENERLAGRLQAMFNQHSAIKIIFDSETGCVMDANTAACRFYGHSRREFLNLKIQDLNMMPIDLQAQDQEIQQNGDILLLAVPQRMKNGETRRMDIYSSIIVSGENQFRYSIAFDVTDRETFRSELMREKELLRTTLQSIGDGVVTTDEAGLVTGMNQVAEQLTGWTAEMAAGLPLIEVVSLREESTGAPVGDIAQRVLEADCVIELTSYTELVSRDGRVISIADSAAPIRTEDGQVRGVVMVFRDVSGEKDYRNAIEHLSYHDALTGLYNRRYIEQHMSELDREENLPISIIMGDLNGLKITNDVFGHKAGDALLQNVATVLSENGREGDLIARWGGDEFVVFMPRTELDAAETFIRRIKDTQISLVGSGLPLSLSLGCARKKSRQENIESILRQAEEYMYHQKLLDGKSYRNAIINTLLATLYEKSNETQEHSTRIEQYCHAIGRRLQLSSREMDELSLLALLHDIGKVSIPHDILKKPGPLTQEEWEEMKRHSEIGYRIARATPELSVVADLILLHHERWDGTGYPRGLRECEIPLACRILGVADAFDAMTNDRVYRKAMGTERAVRELEENAGTQFDPDVTRVFIDLLRETSQGSGAQLQSYAEATMVQ
jgi:diguanylate cyclase (GGDEF)-like protein/PAS domain S-box-containing protein